VYAFKERRELCRRPELRNRIQERESAGEGVGQAPHGPWRELREWRTEVGFMHAPRQMFRRFELSLNEGAIDDELRIAVIDLVSSPGCNLTLHRVEVPLHAIHSNAQSIRQAKPARVLGEHGSEHAGDNVTESSDASLLGPEGSADESLLLGVLEAIHREGLTELAVNLA